MTKVNFFAPPAEPRTICGEHGPQVTPHCPACDQAQGIDREAEQHRQEREALVARLRELGFEVAPRQPDLAKEPGPDEAVPRQTVEEQRAELEAKLAALGG